MTAGALLRRTLAAGLLATVSAGFACVPHREPAGPGGCAAGRAFADAPGNLLINGGFEAGDGPWYYLEGRSDWGGFSVSDRRACHGEQSLRIELRKTESPMIVRGAIQDLAIDRFPDTFAGRYFVESWKRGSSKQYVQVVFIMDPGNRQLRYILAGLDSAPYRTGAQSDARYVFLGKRDPETGKPARDPELGKWIEFKRDLRRDVAELWGTNPDTVKKIRCYYEMRYDTVDDPASEIVADVFYDDLYLGPALLPDR